MSSPEFKRDFWETLLGGDALMVSKLTQLVLRSRGALVTFAANAPSTTIVDARIAHDSPILLQPTTANAAAETWWIAEPRVNGSVTILHSTAASADRIFKMFIG